MTPPISRRQLHPDGSRTDALTRLKNVIDTCELSDADREDIEAVWADILADAQVGAIGLYALHSEPVYRKRVCR